MQYSSGIKKNEIMPLATNTAGGRDDHTKKCNGDKEQKRPMISLIGGH